MADEPNARRQVRVPAPLVLALASAMVSIGAVAFLTSAMPDEGDDEAEAAGAPDGGVARVHVETKTAEGAAETFLDAWRKRRFDIAGNVSRGVAHSAVMAKLEEDARLEPEVREMQQVWDRMATSRLDLHVNESETLDDGHLILRGIAEGEFLHKPYRRRMEFVLRREQERWWVEDMRPGEILTPVPTEEPTDSGVARPEPGDIPMREPR